MSPRYLARGRRRDQDRQHRGSRGAGADTFVAGSAIFGSKDYGHRQRHAAEPLSGKALTDQRVPVVAEARADLYTPLAVYLKLANAVLVPPRVRGRRRALRALLVHRPRLRRAHRGSAAARAAPAARRARRRRLPRKRRGDPFEYARLARAPPRRAGPAALRFGGGLAGYFGYEAVRHIEKNALKEENRSARHARHAAPRLRRARGDGQRARQALPRGLRRPDARRHAQRKIAARASAFRSPALARRALFRREKRKPVSLDCSFTEAAVSKPCAAARNTSWPATSCRCRSRSAPRAASMRRRSSSTGAARREPVALHVLLRLRRSPRGRGIARDPGAARRRYGHAAADRRHAAARRDARSGRRHRRGAARRSRRSAPST